MTEVSAGEYYDNLINSEYTINYASNNSTFGDSIYPEKNMINVFGPIYTPRVYGKDLSSFEIASSGSIALTLTDTMSILMQRDMVASNVMMSTLSNDSFGIYTNSSNMSLVFDSTSNNATMFSQCNVTIDANRDINMIADETLSMTAASFNLNISSNIELTAGKDIILTASNDLSTYIGNDTLFSTSNNLSVSTGNDIIVDAGSNVVIMANNGTLGLYANNSNMYIEMDSGSNTMSIYSTDYISMTTSNYMDIYALSNMYITADTGDLLMSANNSNVYILMDSSTQNLTIYSSNNTLVTASNDVTVVAIGNMDVRAVDVITSATGSVQTYGADAVLSVTNDIIISGGDSNVSVTFDSSVSDLISYAAHDIISTASNDLSITSLSNVSLKATQGTFSVTAAGDKASLTMDSVTNDTTIYTAHDLTMTASNNATLKTVGDVSVSGASGQVYMGFNSATTSASLYAATSMMVDANSGTLSLNGGTANTMKTDGGTFFTLSNNYSAFLGASNMTFSAGQNGVITTVTGSTSTSATTLVDYFVGGNNTLSIKDDRIVVRGGLDILGTINSIDTTITNVMIEDKTLILSHSSNGILVNDGSANTQSGFKVEGTPLTSDLNIPLNVADATVLPIYEKSILWNYNDTDSVTGFSPNVGIGGIGTSNIESESFWEVKGGGLRLTASKPVFDGLGNCTGSNVTSFGLRINHLDELEIVKKYFSGGSYLVKRVAKFGRMLI